MDTISNILYWISTGLLVPVVVLLIVFFVRALLLAGSFFGQYMQQKKTAASMRAAIEGLTPATLPAFIASLPAQPHTLAQACARTIVGSGADTARADLALSDFELDADRAIATSALLTKMGPILGLMGTLIPMGPALVGLATGDISSMAYNMQVAFATTVVGLVVSAVGFLTQQARERWVSADLAMLEYLADVVRRANSSAQ